MQVTQGTGGTGGGIDPTASPTLLMNRPWHAHLRVVYAQMGPHPDLDTDPVVGMLTHTPIARKVVADHNARLAR